MSEEFNMPDPPEVMEAPQKKNRTVLWIILAVVAVILLCLCVVSDSGGFDYYYQIPTLLNLI